MDTIKFEVGSTYYSSHNECYQITITKRTPKTITFTERLSQNSPWHFNTVAKRVKVIGYGSTDYQEAVYIDIFGTVKSNNLVNK
jgi:hypothetical protein